MAMIDKGFGYGGVGGYMGGGPRRAMRGQQGMGMGTGMGRAGMGNAGFYQPNWQGIFGPSLDRYQEQAAQSQRGLFNQNAADQRVPQTSFGNSIANVGYGIRDMIGLPPTRLQQGQQIQDAFSGATVGNVTQNVGGQPKPNPADKQMMGGAPGRQPDADYLRRAQEQERLHPGSVDPMFLGGAGRQQLNQMGQTGGPLQMADRRAMMNQLLANGGLGGLMGQLGRRRMPMNGTLRR